MQSTQSLPPKTIPVNGPFHIRLTCPICDGARRWRQRGDYLWMLCSCTEALPLADRAILAHQVDVANHDAQEAFRAEQERRFWQKRLVEECLRLLGDSPDGRGATWMTWGRPGGDRMFGTVEIDGLDFALLLWDDYPAGQLVLLLDGEPIAISSLPQLGAVLLEQTQGLDASDLAAMADCREGAAHEAEGGRL